MVVLLGTVMRLSLRKLPGMELINSQVILSLLALSVVGSFLAIVLSRTGLKRPLPEQARLAGSESLSCSDLINLLDCAPVLAWAEESSGVVWSNSRFARYCGSFLDYTSGIAAFDIPDPEALITKPARIKLMSGTGREHWFDVSCMERAGRRHYFAVDVDPLVRVEAELARFVQTLTETFAHLPIGLAIFDKSRDLTLFNPALSELLALPPEWLARRPGLGTFLDRLHNDGKLPEPKDFNHWRSKIVELEKTSFTPGYQEDWHLPDGRVYRVTGRPHPQGAVALLFEDISSAILVEREYRAEIEHFQATFDTLHSAIAIFDSTGLLSFANSAFDLLWGKEISTLVTPMNTTEISRFWQKKCDPSPIWGDFRDFAGTTEERSQWTAVARLKTGQVLDISFSPLAGGKLLCEFTLQPDSILQLSNRIKRSA
jgi:PAS domain-containing protein